MRTWLTAHYELLKDFAGPAVTLIGFVVTIALGIIGFNTFGRWRKQEIEQRRMDIAFEALNIAYKTRHVFDHIRGPLISAHEWADMPQVYGDDDHKRTRRGSYYAIGKRLEAHKDFFESVWEVHAKCMAMFGPQVEEIFLELHKARRGVEIAIEMLIRHLDDATMTPDPNADLWQQLRADLCGAEGAVSKEGDRIGRQLIEFRDGIEALCRPVLERGIGKKAT